MANKVRILIQSNDGQVAVDQMVDPENVEAVKDRLQAQAVQITSETGKVHTVKVQRPIHG